MDAEELAHLARLFSAQAGEVALASERAAALWRVAVQSADNFAKAAGQAGRAVDAPALPGSVAPAAAGASAASAVAAAAPAVARAAGAHASAALAVPPGRRARRCFRLPQLSRLRRRAPARQLFRIRRQQPATPAPAARELPRQGRFCRRPRRQQRPFPHTASIGFARERRVPLDLTFGGRQGRTREITWRSWLDITSATDSTRAGSSTTRCRA